jgi:superfamily II DNA helicase RecQ
MWHRFWGFGADDWNGAGRDGAGGKRRRAPFDAHREEARFRRFVQLHQVDIRGALRSMMGDEAKFRGQQETVIRSIIRGEGPIVQVTGTGGGKSMSFMLPAYCSPNGTTIVIVPLTALREDMHGRCEKNKIDSYMWQSRGSHPVTTVVFATSATRCWMQGPIFVRGCWNWET